MPGREVKLDTFLRENKYTVNTIIQRYGKWYRITRVVPEIVNRAHTGYYIACGVEVRVIQ